MNSYISLKKISLVILTISCFCVHQAWTQTCPVSNEITITVSPQPTISITGAVTICTGGSATLTASTTGGTGTCTIQWQASTDGGTTFTPISGANAATYTAAAVATTTVYNATYSCTGTGCNSATSNNQTVTVVPQVTVTAQPQPINECTGGTNSLSVNVTNGTGSISYQWQSSPDNSIWTNITGATSSTYTPSSVSAGTIYYRAIIAANGNGCNPVFSNSAKVIVSPQITVTAEPQPISECTGGTNSLSVTVTGGSGIISYQWQSSPDNVTFTNITGATSSTYTPPSATAATTYYKVLISASDNGCGTVPSSSAKVIVTPQITVTAQPQPINECISGTNSLSVTVTGGSGIISYQWQSSPDNVTFTNITGATSSTYTPSSASAGTTYYKVLISASDNGCGTVPSSSAKVVVTPQLAITNTLSDFDECLGGTQSLTINVTGGVGSPSYQWQSSPDNVTFTNITGETNATFIPPSTSTGITYYRVNISNASSGCTTPPSNAAKVTITPKLSITTQPTNFNECISGTQTLTVVSTGGAGTITYQWQSSPDGSTGWTNISGETATIFTPPSTTSGTYFYRVVVAATGNGCGNLPSNVAKVTIVAKPIIIAAASTTAVCVGGGSVLNATVTGGTGTCIIQWQNSTNGGGTWNDIPAGTGPTYTTPALSSDTKYRARITCSGNGCCN